MNEPVTDTDIVNGLRSEDFATRQRALEQLYPETKTGVLLLRAGTFTVEVTTTKTCDAGKVFVALLNLSQQFGKHLGLQLAWVPEPEDMDAIQVAQGFGPRGGG